MHLQQDEHKSISDIDYEHAQQVCSSMEKKSLGCYHDTYAFPLADVF